MCVWRGGGGGGELLVSDISGSVIDCLVRQIVMLIFVTSHLSFQYHSIYYTNTTSSEIAALYDNSPLNNGIHVKPFTESWVNIDLRSDNILLGRLQPTIYNLQPTIYNLHPISYNLQPTIYNLQHTIYNIQYTTYNIQPTIYNLQSTTYNI